MTYKTYITTALVAATGLALAMPVLAQTAAPGAAAARAAIFDFAKLDANSDGKVTMEEITAARDAEAKALDANGDGKIDVAELTAYRMAAVEAQAKAQIAALDTDGDGALSAAELASRSIVRMPVVIPQAFFDRIDADADGAISQTEFDVAAALVQGRVQAHAGKDMRATNTRTMRNDTRFDNNRRNDNMRGGQDTNRGWLPFWRH